MSGLAAVRLFGGALHLALSEAARRSARRMNVAANRVALRVAIAAGLTLALLATLGFSLAAIFVATSRAYGPLAGYLVLAAICAMASLVMWLLLRGASSPPAMSANTVHVNVASAAAETREAAPDLGEDPSVVVAPISTLLFAFVAGFTSDPG